MNSLTQIDRANRLRWRAHLLGRRAEEVMARPGQFARALRISERVARAHLRADRCMLHLHHSPLTAAA